MCIMGRMCSQTYNIPVKSCIIRTNSALYMRYTQVYLHPCPSQDLAAWKLSPAQLASVNKRSNDLGGEQDWLPSNLHLINKTFKLKAVDFVRLSRGAMSYVFAGVFDRPSTEAQNQAFTSFNESLRLCLTTHFNADGAPLTTRTKALAAALMQQVCAVCVHIHINNVSYLHIAHYMCIMGRICSQTYHIQVK